VTYKKASVSVYERYGCRKEYGFLYEVVVSANKYSTVATIAITHYFTSCTLDKSFDVKPVGKVGKYTLVVNHRGEKRVNFGGLLFFAEGYEGKGAGTFAMNELISIAKLYPDEYIVNSLSLSSVDGKLARDPENWVRRDTFYKNFGFEPTTDDEGNGGTMEKSIAGLCNYASSKTKECSIDELFEKYKKLIANNSSVASTLKAKNRWLKYYLKTCRAIQHKRLLFCRIFVYLLMFCVIAMVIKVL
jgi:hypothetical protein